VWHLTGKAGPKVPVITNTSPPVSSHWEICVVPLGMGFQIRSESARVSAKPCKARNWDLMTFVQCQWIARV